MNTSARRFLVTGGSKGIGRAIALQLAQDNFEVVVNYAHDDASAQACLEEIQSKFPQSHCSLLKCDVTQREKMQQALEQEIAEHGAFYGLVVNAGISRDAAFPAMTCEEWDTVLDTNLSSFFNVVHPCLMPMISLRSGGRIIVLSSLSGQIGNRGQVNYSAAKAGLIGASKALSLELAKRKITVNVVAPGLIETDMIASMNEIARKQVLDAIPLRRMGQPQEVASLVSFLASDQASYITRQVISINGGLA